ncbi:nitrogen fixation protein NifX [Heliobacillus mobilis]|uniref:Nitrogen fixation protein NifX n=1 Tax=Heliobacterium mobile TaxID=28064 RepID=A0A6I3SJY5_HELMO|nr:nitrogen fixation protein NifX [Heliobacterium mobile]MTV49209.1 nitrogen fixation protein NifX [Heliobacterium mobile]
MRIAFATDNQKEIDAHFGQAEAFAIFEVTPHGYESRGFAFPQEQQSSETDKIVARLEVLRGCSLVYCTDIGGPAAARLIQEKMHPLKVEAGTPFEYELQRLQKALAGNLPPWLCKIVHRSDEHR